MHRDWNLIKQVILIIEKSDKNKPLRKQEFESIGASKDALDYTFQLLLDGGYVFPDESLPDLRTPGVGQLTCKGQDLYDKLTAPDKAKEATDEAIDKWLKSDFLYLQSITRAGKMPALKISAKIFQVDKILAY